MEQPQQTAQVSQFNERWVTITHPFHPLHGQVFYILNLKPHKRKGWLVLRDSAGNRMHVPKEWTDAGKSNSLSSILHLSSLLELTEWVDARKKHLNSG